MTRFTEKDREQLRDKGISEEKILGQIETFKDGIPFVSLVKAAVISDGIIKFDGPEEDAFVQKFENSKENVSLLKFVPASGAASRMFKALFAFLESFDPATESLSDYLKRTGDADIKALSEGLQEFPFYPLIRNRIAARATSKDQEVFLFVQEMLSPEKLNYGFFPKGLLPFHNYGDHVATPFEEHLKEAALYAATEGQANLHFTISEQHGEMFNQEFIGIKERISHTTATSFNIGYSYQKSATDTVAVDMENQLFRNQDGSMLFRPGGHGALVENLNDQDADIIFIKNIDNVVVAKSLEQVARSKKILAGLLLDIQERAFLFAAALEKELLTKQILNDIRTFMEERLNVVLQPDFDGLPLKDQQLILKEKINRPIRVCGMVKNEGEPGGGPFWITDRTGSVSLQIVESAQVDTSDAGQNAIFRNSTHFNPVDIVCGVRNHKGKKYNLMDFVDHKQGFITEKTSDGKELKALELPGLWNGGMAFWNTLFVEVPSVTFNPVKTVNDLLKPSHQVKHK
ncbi:MAG: DUF4301 family protein [Sediminicola sp.]